ncbi:hypothetical protein FRB97_005195 [Tulasnella sp. 331]|nr:hypothetical protein FRB97_005195 [Tulasnella sp. 331]
MEVQESPEVQNHIRSLVYNYAKQHITLNHDQYTIEQANQLLSEGLKTIPSLGPTDLVPLTDPVQALLRQWNLPPNGALAYSEEKLSVAPETMAYLQRTLKPTKQPKRRDPFAYDEESYSYATPIKYDTILSRKSQKATLLIGKGTYPVGVPSMLADLVEGQKVKLVDAELVPEPPLNPEQILSLRPQIDIVTQSGIKMLFESLPLAARQRNKAAGQLPWLDAGTNNGTLASFLRCHSPTPKSLRQMSPPIFPRALYRPEVAPTYISEAGKTELADFMALIQGTDRVLLPVKPEEEKIFELAKENFIIVNGWNALPSLSSPTMTPPKSQDSEARDELDDDVWRSSPPFIPLPVGKLGDFHEFMWPHLQPLIERGPATPPMVSIKSELFDMSPSLLGQASSTIQREGDSDPATIDMDDVDGTIENIYRSVKGEDLTAIIMNEKIEQKGALLLDVPALTAPNAQLANFHPPTELKDLLALSPSAKGLPPVVPLDGILGRDKISVSLKKVTGIQSLNIELPWRPFIAGESTIPTLESVTGIGGGVVADEDQEAVNDLLHTAIPATTHSTGPSQRWTLDDKAYQYQPSHLTSPEPMMLSRASLRATGKLEPQEENCTARLGSEIDTKTFRSQDSKCLDDMIPVQAPRRSYSLLPQTWTAEPGDVWEECNMGYEDSAPPPPDAQDTYTLKNMVQDTTMLSEEEHLAVQLEQAQDPPSALHPNSPRSIPDLLSLKLAMSREPCSLNTPEQLQARRLRSLENRDRLVRFMGVCSIGAQLNITPAPPSPYAVATHLRSPSPLVKSSTIPPELLLHVAYTLEEASLGIVPDTIHRYIASFSLIQKRGVTRHLLSREVCAVELVERERAVDVDLILDAGAAVIFFVLPALPTAANDLVNRLSNLSWRYSNILIIFESYPPARSRTIFDHSEDDAAHFKDSPYPFSLPVIKAFKHLRRSLCISESSGSRNGMCNIGFVFALDEVEAARYVRLFAERRVIECAEDTNKAQSGQWNKRDWLVEDIYVGEDELAAFDGMNLFAAIAMVSTVNLTSIIQEMTSDQRLDWFADLVGYDRMINFNSILEERYIAIASSPIPHVSSRHASDEAKVVASAEYAVGYP